MNPSRAAIRRILRAALVAAVLAPAVRADDDIVKDDEPAPAAQNQGFGGMPAGGRVIVMPGLRLQVGEGQGQVQVQVQGGGVGAPGAQLHVQHVVAAPAGDGRKEPFLGVVTGPVAPAVRAQLGLPDDVGLAIEAVAEGSPAAKAGVRQFDVIRMFNDQVVRSPEQLTTLVKVSGAGTKVPLTLVRGGRDQIVEAVLEERPVAPDAGDEELVAGLPRVLVQQMMPPVAAGGLGPEEQAEIERSVTKALAQAIEDHRMQVLAVGAGAESATMVADPRGTIEIRASGGKKTVIVKGPTGQEVHSGPLDTDEDLEKVPEEYRAWVHEVDSGKPVVQPLREREGG